MREVFQFVPGINTPFFYTQCLMDTKEKDGLWGLLDVPTHGRVTTLYKVIGAPGADLRSIHTYM